MLYVFNLSELSLYSVLDSQRAFQNTFQVTTFKVEEGEEFKDFSRENGIQGLPLKFRGFSRLCEHWFWISL